MKGEWGFFGVWLFGSLLGWFLYLSYRVSYYLNLEVIKEKYYVREIYFILFCCKGKKKCDLKYE